MAEILVNGERAGRIWKYAKGIEVRDEKTEKPLAYISVSEDLIQISPRDVRLDVCLWDSPLRNELDQVNFYLRTISGWSWSFETEPDLERFPQLETLKKTRDQLNQMILRMEALQEPEAEARKQLKVWRYGVELKGFWTKNEMINLLELSDAELVEKLWNNEEVYGDLTNRAPAVDYPTRARPDVLEIVKNTDPEDIRRIVKKTINQAKIKELQEENDSLTLVKPDQAEETCPICGAPIINPLMCISCGATLALNIQEES